MYFEPPPFKFISSANVFIIFPALIDGFKSLDFEFSMIWEPNGLIDLENALVKNWDFLRHDNAINNFINYCHILDRKDSKFSKWGGNISNKLSTDFMKESNMFIETSLGSNRLRTETACIAALSILKLSY